MGKLYANIHILYIHIKRINVYMQSLTKRGMLLTSENVLCIYVYHYFYFQITMSAKVEPR